MIKQLFIPILFLSILFSKDVSGIIKSYHDNGEIKSEITYQNGKPNGPYKWY